MAAVKVRSALMSWPQHRIELALAVEGVKFVATANMRLADKNLRKGRARAGAIPHLLTMRRVDSDVEFGEHGFFARQQRLGGAAIAAARAGVDFDGSGHVALCFAKIPDYMGALWVSTTRANTSTSTEAALARNSARAQASTVAPEVRTSSIRIT